MHLHIWASPWHQKDWQPSHTSHGAHHIVKHLNEQRAEKSRMKSSVWQVMIQTQDFLFFKKEKCGLSQLNLEYLIMWFIERDLDCATNMQFTVQYIPQPFSHDSAHRM